MFESIFALLQTIYDNAGRDNIIAFGTVVIAFFTLTLWWSTSKLWKAGEIHSERQLRAYLFNDHANLINFDEVPIVQVLVKNAGQTPAYGVAAWNAVRLAPFPLAVELNRAPDTEIVRCNLGPGMSFHMFTPLSALSEPLKAAIREGNMAFYVFGRAEYRDAFGKDRFLAWRLFYGVDSSRRADGGLSVHPEGNEAS